MPAKMTVSPTATATTVLHMTAASIVAAIAAAWMGAAAT